MKKEKDLENQENLPISEDDIKAGESENSLIISSNFGKDGLRKYLEEIQKFPILTEEEEYEYGMRFKKFQDKEAAKILVQSHLRLVAKMATKFKNYGLPMSDLISEGNIGLIQAVKKFDPEKGFRFSTYAMWWIRAGIQEYVLRSWSLVKIGTTAAQKKLFFNLRRIKKRFGFDADEKFENKSLSDVEVERISDDLNVSKKEVIEMDSRLSGGDLSLNQPKSEGESENLVEMQDVLADDAENQEEIIIDKQEKQRRENLLREAFLVLNDREKDILIKRQMSEVSATLDDLSKIYNISKERIRQVEAAALEKIKKEIARLSQN